MCKTGFYVVHMRVALQGTTETSSPPCISMSSLDFPTNNLNDIYKHRNLAIPSSNARSVTQ